MNKYMISLSVPVIYNMIDFIGKFSYKVMKTATHYLFTNIVDLLLVWIKVCNRYLSIKQGENLYNILSTYWFDLDLSMENNTIFISYVKPMWCILWKFT